MDFRTFKVSPAGRKRLNRVQVMKYICYILPLLLGCAVNAALSAADLVQVRTAALQQIALYPERTAPATVVSLNDSSIAAQVAARIGAIPVRTGDVVKEGDLLVQLDCSDFRLARREADTRLKSNEARIELAQRRLDRTRKLRAGQTVAEELLDERESELLVLQAERDGIRIELERARLDESRCEIRSPFAAAVLERIASVGEFASVGTPLLRLLDLETFEVSAQVPNGDVAPVEQARLLFFEFDGRRFPLGVRNVARSLNPETRNREIRLVFTADPALAGSSGKLVWRDDRPHLPANLFVGRAGGIGVFVEEGGTARFAPVPEAESGRANAVALPPDTRVIVEGQYAVQDGQTVRVRRE